MSPSKSKRNSTLLLASIISGFLFVGLWHQERFISQVSYGLSKSFVYEYLHFLPDIPKRRLKLTKTYRSSRKSSSFLEIAREYGTDKVDPHHYERMYGDKFEPLRNRKLKMLEIGLGCDQRYGPGASYYTWLAYFPHVDLYFIEYDAKCALKWVNETKGATIFIGDQSDPNFLESFMTETGGDFDIIIDDGGHTMTQQKTSLAVLWEAVKPGGMYFVEDLATSYHPRWGGGVGKKAKDSFMTVVKNIMDDMNLGSASEWFSISSEVLKIDFTQECIGLTKKTGKEATDPVPATRVGAKVQGLQVVKVEEVGKTREDLDEEPVFSAEVQWW